MYMARRLPVYLLIDTTGSMKGEPIESARIGIEAMLNTLRQDPYALESVYISIITYDTKVNQLLPLTPLEELQMPEITTKDSGSTHLDAALEMLLDKVEKEVIKCTNERAGDRAPKLFIFTDGQNTDDTPCNQLISRVKSSLLETIVCYIVGQKPKTDYLTLLTNDVYRIDNLYNTNLMKFFTWKTGFPGEYGLTTRTDEFILPPPPDDVIVI